MDRSGDLRTWPGTRPAGSGGRRTHRRRSSFRAYRRSRTCHSGPCRVPGPRTSRRTHRGDRPDTGTRCRHMTRRSGRRACSCRSDRCWSAARDTRHHTGSVTHRSTRTRPRRTASRVRNVPRRRHSSADRIAGRRTRSHSESTPPGRRIDRGRTSHDRNGDYTRRSCRDRTMGRCKPRRTSDAPRCMSTGQRRRCFRKRKACHRRRARCSRCRSRRTARRPWPGTHRHFASATRRARCTSTHDR